MKLPLVTWKVLQFVVHEAIPEGIDNTYQVGGWPICDRVEENFICCGEFSISGGGLGLLLNFCMPLVEMCM